MIVIGAGIIGVCCALKLAERGLNVVVVEKDSSYERSSTVRSDGNQRIQFNLKENIQIS